MRTFYRLRKTFWVRLVIGPPMAILSMMHEQAANFARGDFRYAPIAIDCVTCGNLKLHEPRLLRGLRVLAESEAMPGLPLVASQRVDDDICALLQDVLTKVFSSWHDRTLATRLRLGGFTRTTMEDYARIAEAEQRAAALGYLHLA